MCYPVKVQKKLTEKWEIKKGIRKKIIVSERVRFNYFYSPLD